VAESQMSQYIVLQCLLLSVYICNKCWVYPVTLRLVNVRCIEIFTKKRIN